MRAIAVVAARPNFMKIKPVLTALESRDIHVSLVHTGQHYDDAMSAVFFSELGLRPPEYHLGVGSGSQAEITGRVMQAFEPLVLDLSPDFVLVAGDVTSTMACALAAAKAGPIVAHIEAGLRSRDWAMPEEVNRVVTDRVSDLLFAPSADATDNLRNEGYRKDQIHLVGNVMVDTLLSNIGRARERSVVADLGLIRRKFALLTLHRPSNVDTAETLGLLLRILGELKPALPVVFPVHPRTAMALSQTRLPPNVHPMGPVGYLDFIALEDAAAVVFTDSGGVQEETTMLGVPCVTLRQNTERPITVTCGTNVVVGHDRDRILTAATDALEGRVAARHPALWDGQASQRIADVLSNTPSSFLRPTSL